MSVLIETAIISAAQPQCQFFVIRKKRLCRMTVRPGRQYCGEHEPQPQAENNTIDKRVPCPNDPKHTCYVSKLEQHLTKCNARQVEDPPYIIRNINATEQENTSPRVPLKDVPTDILQRVIEKVNAIYDKHVKSTIGTYCPPVEYHAAVAGCIAQADRTDSSRRHLRQASRLMQLAEDEQLVAPHTCYVELGAGKGMLSYYMGCAWCGADAESRVLCVDRASLRHKRDNLLPGCTSRLRADLRHLALHLDPTIASSAAVVGVAKHLCGVATDYALRCMSGGGVLHKARGVLLATCCHHRCEQHAYVGGPTLQELGITDEELNVMFGIVSWATCGDGRSRERRLAEDGINPKREENGHIDTDTTKQEQTIPQHDTRNSQERDEHTVTETTANTNTHQIVSSQERDGDIDTDASKQELSTQNDTRDSQERDVHIVTETTADTNTHQKVSLQERDEIESETNGFKQVSLLPLPVNVRGEIGRRAKAVLDYGRVLYLREKGFQARLCYYVPSTESLENVCIVAKKDVL